MEQLLDMNWTLILSKEFALLVDMFNREGIPTT